MNFFAHSNKNKKPGISLLVAMIGSSIALGVVTAIMISLTQSVEQAQNIERSTQVFFAVESGLEAGFFHHNARGQGTEFLPLDDATFETAAAEQIILHENVNLSTKWTIDGRADDTFIEDEIREFTPLQLRWFWDDSTTVKEKINIVSENPHFSFELTNPTGFDFDIQGGIDEPVASWLITKKDNTGVFSLSPSSPDPKAPCNTTGTTFICDNKIPFTLSHSLNSEGSLAPRTITSDKALISDFTTVDSLLNTRNFQVIINPLRSFTKANGSTISGMPFNLNGDVNLPLPYYRVDTQVEALGFVKNITLDNIPESSAISAFNYVIFN